MRDRSDASLTGVVALVSGVTRGLFDPWLDSIAVVTIRRRNAVRRRNDRLKEAVMEDASVDRDDAYRQIKSDLADSLEEAGTNPLSQTPLDKLGAVYWNISVMMGLLESELAHRDGTTDMASQEPT